MLAKYKFRGDYVIGQAFEPLLQQMYQAEFSDCMVVPIPLSNERLYERGFNQAKHLAELIGVPVFDVLKRTTHEQKQSKKSRTERLSLEKSPFEIQSNESIQNKPILIIDDIYTTGATIRQAAKVLLDSGAKEVSSLTVGRS
ncbi:ComF family protein [Anaerobacillus sp. MEB173]